MARIAQKNRTQERHKLKSKNIRFKAELKEQTRVWLQKGKLSPELIAAKWELDVESQACPMKLFIKGFGKPRKASIGYSPEIGIFIITSAMGRESVQKAIKEIPEESLRIECLLYPKYALDFLL